MANEAKPGEVVSITECGKFSDDISEFYNEEFFSDLIIVVEGRRLNAHKIILATRCKYFRSLLCDDPKQTEIAIPDVSYEVFQKILKYIYTGSVSIETDFIADILKLAHEYSLKDLETAISEKMTEVLDMSNVCGILNKANLYNMTQLRENCHTFIDVHILDNLGTEFLNILSQKSMVKLLERDDFYVPEIEIFKIVEKWCKSNQDVDNSVMNCVRLSCLTTKEIMSTVWPSKLVEDSKLLEVLAEINDESKPSQARVRLEIDKNLALGKYKSRIISGANTSEFLNGNEDLTKCAYHSINDKNGITIDLRGPTYFNHVKMRLDDTKNNYYRYYIEASLDQKTWHKILDYQMYDCRSYQNLYFEKQFQRFVRIVGTFASSGKEFRIANFEVYYKSVVPRIINQLVCPVENVATPKMGATVTVTNGAHEDVLLNGISDHSQYTYHVTNKGNILIQLAQPYMLGSIKMLLHNDAGYSYFIEASINNIEWTTIVDRKQSNEKLWQILHFEDIPMIYIKIKGTSCLHYGGCNSRFGCNHFECPIQQ